MKSPNHTPSRPCRPRCGLSLVETAISVVLVGVAFAAALNTVGAVRLSQRKVVDHSRGELLAESLMSEILAQTYADREAGEDSFGLDADEVADGSRVYWDDVDDYSGFQDEGLPRNKDGVPIDNLDGWSRSAQVVWVNPSNIAETVASNQGAKRITVEVHCGDALAARLVAVKTVGLPEIVEVESEEMVLISHDDAPAASDKDYAIEITKWAAAYFKPTLPSNTISWKITRVELVARQEGPAKDRLVVQMRTADDQMKPGATVLAELTRDEPDLPPDFAWTEFEFPALSDLDPSAGLCLVLGQTVKLEKKAAKIQYQENGNPMTPNTHWMTSSDGGASWTDPVDNRDLRFIVHGTVTTLGPPE